MLDHRVARLMQAGKVDTNLITFADQGGVHWNEFRGSFTHRRSRRMRWEWRVDRCRGHSALERIWADAA